MFQTSLSAVQSWQRCQQQFAFRYVLKLRPRVRDVAPQRGIVLHDYLAAYYGQYLNGNPAPEDAHAWALAVVRDRYDSSSELAAQAAFLFGDEKMSQEYQDMPAVIQRMAGRYFTTRGRYDALKYKVVMVEESIKMPLTSNIVSASVIDLVLIERDWPYRTALVEHKSTGSVPEPQVRIWDLQTLLYADVLEKTRDIKVDFVLWNYIRTKEPTVPQALKTGKGLSRAKDIDTTWDVYREAAIENGFDPEDYADLKERLDGREETHFFPRFEHLIVARPEVLMRDYVAESVRMDTAATLWEKGYETPTRSIERSCAFCSFRRICEAAITGGDEQTIIDMYFQPPKAEALALDLIVNEEGPLTLTFNDASTLDVSLWE